MTLWIYWVSLIVSCMCFGKIMFIFGCRKLHENEHSLLA